MSAEGHGRLAGAMLLVAMALAPVLLHAEAPVPSGPVEPAAAAAPTKPALPAAAAESLPVQGPMRFKLTPEQQETLRLAREAEARALLGLAPDASLPAASALTDEQKSTIRAAREAEMRRVLGLAPTEAIPDRGRATQEQLRKIEAAHEARVRAALGLADDALLEREPVLQPVAPGAPE